ncbi:c6 finger domain [Pyrenophora seminiperda CCB06]|uniref:C6 finger domain n=1 Tax=Pyrenophora seminiperda CCB06 TaxID=1302712 RepID=A0A3M7MHR5_9PLEO|nr:c6 finger domain [Pyrenophora seminiperda CCB06]
MPKEETLPTRKKMRKGTHSCFECRRRKIRCIFQADNPDVCSECFARGSRCIDQEHANPEVIVDHRKNLRERVSRLEALVDTLLEDKTVKSESHSHSQSQSLADTSSPKPNNVYTKDTFPPTPLSTESSSNIFQLSNNQRAVSDRGHHVPILSAFEDALNDAEAQAKARGNPQPKSMTPKSGPAPDERYTIESRHDDDIAVGITIAHSAKRERAKQGLIAMLPPFDQLTKILNSNSEWWQTWRRKCSGTSGTEQTLPRFAAHALTTGNIGAIATVVLAVGISSSNDYDDAERYFEAVDRWFLSDDEYAASLEGMECLILKSKWYADVGQPRRAWIAYRKALMYAQLMGLHRKRTSSAAHESIWWSLYHGDRFLSLLLGLPYGISDAHCDLTMPELSEGPYLHPMIVMTKLSQLAGKVIDRNQGVAEQSFAWALQLDQELEDLWKRLDPAWIDYTELLADADTNAAELRERIMGQMVFHQIRVYLHLPFMLKSASNSRFSYSRTACLNGSREVLRLYQSLRTGTVQPLYECKAIDFIGFTAAVLIQLGLLNTTMHVQSSGTPSAKDIEEDVRLIEVSIDIFRRASSEKGGRVAAQSAQVLEKMMGKFKGTSDELDGPPEQSDFVIPYFGTISIKRGGQVVKKAPSPPSSASPCMMSSRSPANSHLYTPTPSSDVFSRPTQSLNLTPKRSVSAASTGTTAFNLAEPSPFVSYDGFYNWNNLGGDDHSPPSNAGFGSHINDDSMNNFPLPTNNFSWQNMPMDIDQDWSWFLNDAQTTQQHTVGVASGPAPSSVPLDAFNASGFTGFG